jgi:lysozyme family protein
MAFPFTEDLQQEYQGLFDSCLINAGRLGDVSQIVSSIVVNRPRYQSVGGPLGIPWFFVGAIHNMESSLNFHTHLHNGDPLTARTVHVPSGRPLTGQPPFTWEESATDALTLEGFANQSDWSLPRLLYRLEKFNGSGYRNPVPPRPINTPYLWSFSNHYISGKFTEDHGFDPDVVSDQCGAAVILSRMVQGGVITFAASPVPAPQPAPAPALTASQLVAKFDDTVAFSTSQKSDAATALQQALNTFPSVNVDVDGFPGRQTSDAYEQVTGHFLRGDPLG